MSKIRKRHYHKSQPNTCRGLREGARPQKIWGFNTGICNRMAEYHLNVSCFPIGHHGGGTARLKKESSITLVNTPGFSDNELVNKAVDPYSKTSKIRSQRTLIRISKLCFSFHSTFSSTPSRKRRRRLEQNVTPQIEHRPSKTVRVIFLRKKAHAATETTYVLTTICACHKPLLLEILSIVEPAQTLLGKAMHAPNSVKIVS